MQLKFDLGPGQILVLPRGWMHNPHARSQREDSVHVTFVARERTGYWIAGKLAQAALTSTPLRRAIPPASVVDPVAFASQVADARGLLTHWLAGADIKRSGWRATPGRTDRPERRLHLSRPAARNAGQPSSAR